MYKYLSRVLVLVLAVAVTLSLGTIGVAKAGSVTLSPSSMKWGPAPKPLPPMVKLAALYGNPAQPGDFVIRLMIPAGTKFPAHWHSTLENVTVINGTFAIGFGSRWDDSKLTALGPGGFVSIPANTRHFALGKTDTVIQINGPGPFTMTFVK